MNYFNSDLEQCLRVLADGGVILFPGDVGWLLGCDATNPQAIIHMKKLLHAPSQASPVLMVGWERDVLRHVASPDMQLFAYLEQQQQPTTVLYPNGLGVSDNALFTDGSIAIRIVTEDFCRHLCRRFRRPVATFTANSFQQLPPVQFSQVPPGLVTGVAYAVYYGRQQKTGDTQPVAICWNGEGNISEFNLPW